MGADRDNDTAGTGEPEHRRRPPDRGTEDPTAPREEAEPEGEEEDEEVEPRFFEDPRKLAKTGLAVVVILVAIYLLLPSIVGVEDGLEVLADGEPAWIAVAVALGVAMFVAYVALFRGIIGGSGIRLRWGESYQITLAGLAATRLFSAGGAGGIVLTYWALRKAGMHRKQSAARMVAFLVLLYAVYMLALVVGGVLLRAGALPGPAPVGLTLIPAGIAGGLILVFLLIALIPGDLERRFSRASQERRRGRIARRLASVPSTLAVGTRTALEFVRTPSRGGLAVLGAAGFWAANIGILWAAFKAFGADVPIAVVVQGFFVGMAANLLPFAPGGVGAVDAGMIGAFVLFNLTGVSDGTVFAAVLTYRLVAFWLPIPPGVVAFIQLRRTVARWERERPSPGVGSDLSESLPGTITSQSKV